MSNSSHSVKIVTHNLELGHKSSFNFEMKFAICAVCIWKRRGRYGTCYRGSGEHRWHWECVTFLLLSLIFFFFFLRSSHTSLSSLFASSSHLLLPSLSFSSSSNSKSFILQSPQHPSILLSLSPPILTALSSFSLPIHPLFFLLPPQKTRHCFLRLADEEGGGMKGCEAPLAQFYTWSRFLESQRGSHGVCCIRVFVMWCAVTCVQCCGGVRRLQSYSFRADGGLRRRRKKTWKDGESSKEKGGLRA